MDTYIPASLLALYLLSHLSHHHIAFADTCEYSRLSIYTALRNENVSTCVHFLSYSCGRIQKSHIQTKLVYSLFISELCLTVSLVTSKSLTPKVKIEFNVLRLHSDG